MYVLSYEQVQALISHNQIHRHTREKFSNKKKKINRNNDKKRRTEHFHCALTHCHIGIHTIYKYFFFCNVYTQQNV